MNITLDDPLHTPVYYNRMNPFNNFAPVDGRPWCVRRVVITGAQVSTPHPLPLPLSVSLYPIAREPPGPAPGSHCACLTMLSFPLARILGFFGCCCLRHDRSEPQPCVSLLRPFCIACLVQVYGFPDFVTALEYRRRAYAYVGLPPPPLQQLHARDTPRMITILDRPRIKPRHIHNIAAMLVGCSVLPSQPGRRLNQCPHVHAFVAQHCCDDNHFHCFMKTP